MNINLERVNQSLKPFLLQNIIIKTDKKIIKKGKLKLFKIKQYNISLSLEIDGKIKIYEIPYPFKIEGSLDKLIFNYRISSFIPEQYSLFIKLLDCSSKSKFYDNLLYILPNKGTIV